MVSCDKTAVLTSRFLFLFRVRTAQSKRAFPERLSTEYRVQRGRAGRSEQPQLRAAGAEATEGGEGSGPGPEAGPAGGPPEEPAAPHPPPQPGPGPASSLLPPPPAPRPSSWLSSPDRRATYPPRRDLRSGLVTAYGREEVGTANQLRGAGGGPTSSTSALMRQPRSPH